MSGLIIDAVKYTLQKYVILLSILYKNHANKKYRLSRWMIIGIFVSEF